MEQMSGSDTFEMQPFKHNYHEIEPVHEQTTYDDPFLSMKHWYQRSVLRSGQGYLQIERHDKPGRLMEGWRVGSLVSCIFVGAVLCFNSAFTIYAVRVNPPSKDGIGKLKQGSCDSVLPDSTYIHIAINVCSTIVVAASNYNMQCLTALTREEIDKIHKREHHVQIGIHSVKNLARVRTWKVFLWLVLLLSTLPLHLLWNSAIFSVTTVNEYAGLVVMSSFGDTEDYGIDCSQQAMARFQQTDLTTNTSSDAESYTTCWLLSEAKANRLTKVRPADCIKKYPKRIQTSGYNFIAVANDSNIMSSEAFPAKARQPVLAYFDSMSYSPKLQSWCQGQCPKNWCKPWETSDLCDLHYPQWPTSIETNTSSWCNAANWDSSKTTFACYQYATNGSSWAPSDLYKPADWTCSTDDIYKGDCSGSNKLKKDSPWTILPENYVIDYCLVSEANFECELQYSSSILYAVVTCNAVKFLAILFNLLVTRNPILATVGDAVSSFLEETDMTTRGDCLYTDHDLQGDFYGPAERWIGDSNWKPRIWTMDSRKIQCWIRGTSWHMLSLLCCIWLACLVLGGMFFDQARELTASQSIIGAGLGAMNIGALVATSAYEGGSNASILTTSLVVNSPQVVFSSLYFVYNTMYTSMASAYEWSLFAHKRKALRVTSPRGSQRSSYWLQLPWKYSLPLVAASALLHWLISQSIFLVNARIQTPTNQLLKGSDEYFPLASASGTITAIGFSPLAILLAIVVGTMMFVCLLVVCCFALKPGIPLVNSSSRAISAACHAHPNDKNAATKPLLWGAMDHQDGLKPGHCCFTSFPVNEPRVGDMYA